MIKTGRESSMSFWAHLDVLRIVIIKVIAVAAVFALLAFILKEELFAIILAPKNPDFITYRLLYGLRDWMSETDAPQLLIQLVSTGLAEQFIIHMETALYTGLLCAAPYFLYQLYRFVSPALYPCEQKYAVRLIGGGYVMFIVGVLVSYYLVFPLTFRFLGTYQVSKDIANMITLHSYISVLMSMSLAMGLVFEIPVLTWLLAKFRLISVGFMCKFRRHALVLILVIAAIITPTSDIFTLLLVAIPMWLLYEASIWIVKITMMDVG